MGEVARPGLGTRIRAAIASERSADVLEAMRHAGRAVRDELAHARLTRQELHAAGTTAWDYPPGVASHLTATYHVLVQQCLGEALLDVEYEANPGTVGYVPDAVFSQVWSWFSTVPVWLARARLARANADYDLRRELQLPADLPPWRPDADTLPYFVDAVLAVVPRMREHVTPALAALEHGDGSERRRARAHELQQLLIAAESVVDYTVNLRRAAPRGPVPDGVWEHLVHAFGNWHRVAQFTEFPVLMSGNRNGGTRGVARVDRPPARWDPATLPGSVRFDPWCLTDPATSDHWQSQRFSCDEVNLLWSRDPDPSATLQLKAEVDAAEAAGEVVRVRLDSGATCYFRCPWSPLYEVRAPVTIGGQAFGVFQQFAFDVSAEALASGGPFVRRLVPGPFEVS